MPYLKALSNHKAQVKLYRLLKSYGITGPKLANAIDMKSATSGKLRLESPELLTVEDLCKISRRFHIPADEIREAINFT